MTDLSDLDALISREIGHKDRRIELAAARKEPISPDQAARILTLEEALDWHPVSQHLLLVAHQCECGTAFSFSTGLMVCQKHRRDPTAVRWIRVSRKRDLPFGRAIEESVTVPACLYCHPFDKIEQMVFSPFPDAIGAYNGSPETPAPNGTPHPDRGHPLRSPQDAPLQPGPGPDTSRSLQPILREALARLLLP